MYNGILNIILIKPKETITAKPNETTINIVKLVISPVVTVSIWFAKTKRLGSAIDIRKPRIRPEIYYNPELISFK
ncbi:hypothetical protein PRVXT_002131 [Proteinivorax tanatarense]|uniref:Uncharacterized protein n=1 Tax=Proteinivorax tanatarense TaxID=1260629 RepID=A0AAU7VJD4_9FIRM